MGQLDVLKFQMNIPVLVSGDRRCKEFLLSSKSPESSRRRQAMQPGRVRFQHLPKLGLRLLDDRWRRGLRARSGGGWRSFRVGALTAPPLSNSPAVNTHTADRLNGRGVLELLRRAGLMEFKIDARTSRPPCHCQGIGNVHRFRTARPVTTGEVCFRSRWLFRNRLAEAHSEGCECALSL